MIRVPFISLILALAVAACGGQGPVDEQAGNIAGLPDIASRSPSASGEPHMTTTASKAATPTGASIPVALQGRWGLTPADCTSARGDAKGLLVAAADHLQFYESNAVPVSAINSDAASIQGNFAFTGEGQKWTRYEAIKAGRNRLMRTEINPAASFSYAKCD